MYTFGENPSESAVFEPENEAGIEFDETMTLKEYLRLQQEEALGLINMYYAGQALGHTPSESEAMKYYIKNGGAEDFCYRNFRHRSDVLLEEKIKLYKNQNNI